MKKSGYRDVLRTFVGISPVPALHLHESIAVVRTVTVVWAGVIVRVVKIVRITPIPPPRVPIETETGNEKTIMAEKTAMAVKVPKTPVAEATLLYNRLFCRTPSIEIIDSHSLKEITSCSFCRPVDLRICR